MRRADLMRRSDWSSFYWSDSATSRATGESLRTCMAKYGVGGWQSEERDMVAALIFLDAERSPANSWLLGVKRYSGDRCTATLYENDNDVVAIPSDSVLGEELAAALAASVFESC